MDLSLRNVLTNRIVFIHLYSASNSMSVSGAHPTTALIMCRN